MPTERLKPGPAEFRRRFLTGEVLLGTFLKTPTGHATEVLGHVGFDFVVIDQEHAPFDRGTIDLALLAARAAGIAGIVRVAEPTAAKLLAVLDDGAAGVLVPHVSSPGKARDVVAACAASPTPPAPATSAAAASGTMSRPRTPRSPCWP